MLCRIGLRLRNEGTDRDLLCLVRSQLVQHTPCKFLLCNMYPMCGDQVLLLPHQVFLVIVLLVSLCVSTTIFRRRSSPAPGRIYRSQHVFDDHPPSYSKATGQNRYLNKGREFLAKVTINQKRGGGGGEDKQ